MEPLLRTDRLDRPDFTVITPSFNMIRHLEKCCASVADQDAVAVQHLVIDACSTDGTPEWLRAQQSVEAVVEKDAGMYDALNKGLDRAAGSYISYLNCDEQYLPGALARARRIFEANPEIDVLFGGILLVRPDGSLLSYRKPYTVRSSYIKHAHLYVAPAAMFFRRRTVEAGMRFNHRFRTIGDMVFVLELLRRGFRVHTVPDYFTAFTQTGSNLGSSPRAMHEIREFRNAALGPWRVFSPLVNACRRIEKALSGAYRERFPLRYALVAEPGQSRKDFVAAEASFRWLEG